MPKDFEIKDATMLLAPANYTMDRANFFSIHLQNTDIRDQKEKTLSP